MGTELVGIDKIGVNLEGVRQDRGRVRRRLPPNGLPPDQIGIKLYAERAGNALRVNCFRNWPLAEIGRAAVTGGLQWFATVGLGRSSD